MEVKISLLRQIIKEEIRSALHEDEYHTIEELSDKYKQDKELYLAHNQSYWQWEYDTSITHAFLYLDESNTDIRKKLRLVIVNEHIKSGIGQGSRLTNEVNEYVGTLVKPELAKIRGLLKQHSHKKTRAGNPFKKLWENPNNDYKEQDLTSILREYQNV